MPSHADRTGEAAPNHSATRLTARQLNRATLARQLLLRRERLGVVEAIHRVVALQAQAPPSPYLALWNRLLDFQPGELDRAFADASVVKATLLRATLHAVDASDYPAFHEAMQPTLRATRLPDPRFQVAGLSVEQTDALIADVLEFGSEPRTNADMEAWLDARLGVLPRPGVWWALRTYAPFRHAPTGGPWSFGQRPSYVAADDRQRLGDAEAALEVLVRRYLEGFGPATIADVGRFALIRRTRLRAAIAALGGSLEQFEGPNGELLFDVRGGLLPAEDALAPPRLMAMWDSTLLAYADRGRIVPEPYRRHVIRVNGDVLPTLLVDGYVAGVWRPVGGGIEATAFEALSPESWHGLEVEARALAAFLAEREPAVYTRYGHWWKTLPSAEVRVL